MPVSFRSWWSIATLWVASACAGGSDIPQGGSAGIGAGESTTTGGSFTSTVSEMPTSTTNDSSAADSAMPPDLGACTDDGDCVLQDTLCFEPQGRCEGGSCKFDARIPGAPCDDADPCTEDDMCDGFGGCFGNDLECGGPNASGGTCVDGVCTGVSCDPGWGDCDGDPSTGCEAALTSADHCGNCGAPCTAGDNATADCSTGTCERTCDSPYENCDGDWQNGCEIPTGIPNQCDINGLNPDDGCWTAYCGQSADPDAVNFGTWYCFECTTCHVPAAGSCQWCSHADGRWYPAEADCACGAYEDLTCG